MMADTQEQGRMVLHNHSRYTISRFYPLATRFENVIGSVRKVHIATVNAS